MNSTGQDSPSSADLIGRSEPMRRLGEAIDRAAATDATVLIVGETGTGKEIIANRIHQNSSRRTKPLVPIVCSEYPESLLESELFGYEKGAHSTASEMRAGKFEQADGGTIFLDEVHTLPLGAQVKLLRVLQLRAVVRAGSRTAKPISLNIRVLAATNENLEKAVREGRFREDLFYRLVVLIVPAPPLREHAEDIPALAEHFATEFAARDLRPAVEFTAGALRLLQEQSWPGNVRQFQNVIDRVVNAAAANQLVTEQSILEALAQPSVFETLGQFGAGVSTAPSDPIADLVFDDLVNARIPLEGIKNRSQVVGAVAQRIITGFEVGLKQFLGTDRGQKLLQSLSSGDVLSRVGLSSRRGGRNAFFISEMRDRLTKVIQESKESL